jgi:hypothetical protein
MPIQQWTIGCASAAISAKKMARTENYFSAVTGKLCPNKKEGKRPGLNQYHFPGCVLEVIKILDVNGGKRLP